MAKEAGDVSPVLPELFRSYELAHADPRSTFFIDGGVLDNKPFGHAIGAIKRRAADSEVERRLLYLEPDPGGGGGAAPGGDSPSPIATVLASISGLPRQEPVLDDILEVNRHNERVLRIREIVETSFDPIRRRIEEIVGTELDRLTREQSPADVVRWRTGINEDAKAAAGFAYPTYVRSKVSGVVDSFARTICSLSDFPDDSNQAAFVRGVVRAWAEHASATGRVRRAGARRGSGRVPVHVRPAVPCAAVALRDRRAQRVVRARRGARLPDACGARRGQAHALGVAGAADRRDERPGAAHEPDLRRDAGLRPGADRHVDPRGPRAGRVRGRSRRRARARSRRSSARRSTRGSPEPPRRSTWSFRLSAGWAAERRAELIVRYLGFPYWDLLLFPLQSVADAGERDTIEVVRMSPRDAKLLPPLDPGKPKELAGFKTMHFGAFFDRAGREQDYLWGRLDGAERLIGLVLGAAFTDDERADWCRKAFAAICEEEEDALTNATALLDKAKSF